MTALIRCENELYVAERITGIPTAANRRYNYPKEWVTSNGTYLLDEHVTIITPHGNMELPDVMKLYPELYI